MKINLKKLSYFLWGAIPVVSKNMFGLGKFASKNLTEFWQNAFRVEKNPSILDWIVLVQGISNLLLNLHTDSKC